MPFYTIILWHLTQVKGGSNALTEKAGLYLAA